MKKTTKKMTIDVERVAAALAELDALVLEHPELRNPEHQERLRGWILLDRCPLAQ
jgi:hypothetical protein